MSAIRYAVVMCLLMGAHGSSLRSSLRVSAAHDHVVKHVHDHSGGADAKYKVHIKSAAFQANIDNVLSETNNRYKELTALAHKGAKLMSVDEAIKNVQLPDEVSQLVAEDQQKEQEQAEEQKVEQKKVDANDMGLDPAAIDRAVLKLNDMIMKAYMKLDEKHIECWEFKERNRGTFNQVVTDLSRIGGSISDLERIQLKSTATIAEIDETTQKTEEEMAAEQKVFDNQWGIDSADLKIKVADLEVAEFMLGVTKCKGEWPGQFIQTDGKAEVTTFSVKTCSDGEIEFSDSRLQNSTKQLSPQGLKMLEAAYHRAPLDDGGVDAADAIAEAAGATINDDYDDGDGPVYRPHARAHHAALLAQPKDKGGKGKGMGEGLKMAPLTAAPKTVPPAKSPPKKKQQGKCASAKPDCAVLHDVFASLWGEMKDLVEAKQEKMDHDMAVWKKTEANFNSQLSMMALQMGQTQAILAEATSSKATETDEQTKKVLEKQALQKEYDEYMAECRARKRYIFWTEVCGVIKVRGEVLKQGSDEQKEAPATDCEVSSWVPGQCSSPCDPQMKGGTQTLTREVITANTKYGHACPALAWQRKCNEIKCPVDCKVGKWSGWSKCTKECGGGVQSRNRHLLVKPKDGGRACDSIQESQPCNSFSCDRDCVLNKWTKHTPCTKACGGGFQEKFRHIKRPARANGFCPSKNSGNRYHKQKCNQQACVGDEVCVAEMDLVIAIDCSGSLSEKGFNILRNFAKSIITRMKEKAYGLEAVKVAIIQFGNGELDDKTKVVSDAIVVSGLSEDFAKTKEQMDGMVWKKGFTNMAQAFLKANQLITRSARKSAAGTVLMITDGKPSFSFQTDKAVKEAKGRSRIVIVQVKQFAAQDTVEKMKSYASKPWQTNYLLIPGKASLKADYGKWADKCLVSTCPRAESPSAIAALARRSGFQKIFEGAVCAQTSDTEVIDAASAAECYADSAGYSGVKAFAYSAAAKCLLYKKECKEDMLEPNATYDVYSPFTASK
eukprot:gnl/TRDRNA2_/TRDRNA2_175299_c6_seq25.p1 gnl/TRDRNA2_/TRDRNA2_175299_c6~~gnl/TRDRNA2_/TRDRNA2_175299_c6_seq25.p1  ORF type:complete len:1007 (+),score=247.69 gnl/TRDRNA2_/TRDRNA2_175299_c6_seq25:82-3102(+)